MVVRHFAFSPMLLWILPYLFPTWLWVLHIYSQPCDSSPTVSGDLECKLELIVHEYLGMLKSPTWNSFNFSNDLLFVYYMLLLLLFVYYMCMPQCMWKVREQLEEGGSQLPPYGSQGSSSLGRQAWWQAPFTPNPSVPLAQASFWILTSPVDA